MFAEFWRIYPRRIAKQRAERTWDARMNDEKHPVTPEQLIQAATNYAECCRIDGTPEHYIMHPGTFLGPDHRYKDYLDAECIEKAQRAAMPRRGGYQVNPKTGGDDDDFWDRISKQ